MQGRAAVPIDGVHVRATPDEQLDGLRATRHRRPVQRGCPPYLPSGSLTAAPLARCRSMAPRSPASAAAQMSDAPSAGATLAGLPGGGRHRDGGDPDRGRDDGDHPQQQGEEHPEEPVLDQRPCGLAGAAASR